MKRSDRMLLAAEGIFFFTCLFVFAADKVSLASQTATSVTELLATAVLTVQVMAFSAIFIILPGYLVLLIRNRSDRTPLRIGVGLIGLAIILAAGIWLLKLFMMVLSPQA